MDGMNTQLSSLPSYDYSQQNIYTSINTHNEGPGSQDRITGELAALYAAIAAAKAAFKNGSTQFYNKATKDFVERNDAINKDLPQVLDTVLHSIKQNTSITQHDLAGLRLARLLNANGLISDEELKNIVSIRLLGAVDPALLTSVKTDEGKRIRSVINRSLVLSQNENDYDVCTQALCFALASDAASAAGDHATSESYLKIATSVLDIAVS